MKPDKQKILSLIDLTSLGDADTAEMIALLCNKAISPLGHVAAVCIYPQFVKQAVSFFQNKPVKIATVANFPQANHSWQQVKTVIEQAIGDGADEIDVVFPYPQFLAGEKEAAFQFIDDCKTLCGDVTLKVILETGALQDSRLISEVSHGVIAAGADFLKTSTGKIPVGATLEAARVMLQAMASMGRHVGFKASGGVRTAEQASSYIMLAEEVMGDGWVTPQCFRIGASQLVDELLS